VNSDQRVKAERAWLAAATEWAREHPEANAAAVIAAVPNPHNLLVRPLAGAAVTVAGWDRETKTRKAKFLTEHPQVKIWFDAGGWHARWPVGDEKYTGISHPSELTGLLDRLEALEKAAR
jgi:hypothetical protein